MRTISIGNDGFESIREKNCFYVDKTGFIKEWWESEDKVTLITRPRRFGKTLNMNMLNCFFSNQYAGRGELFEGLAVWEEEKYRRLQGTFPVVFFTFADVKAASFEGAAAAIKQNITELYNQYDFLRKGDLLNEKEKEQYDSVRYTMEDSLAVTAIRTLMGYLSRYYGKKVLVLLDEYDTPLQEAYVSGYWEEMTSFLRGLYHAAFKTNPYLERAVLTGITRISKESIFSDLNNLEVVTATSDKYAAAFGFTEEEVFEALEEAGMPEQKEEVKAWYDGFTFGSRRDIYNPWSITNFLDSGKFGLYWADSSSNALVSHLIRAGDAGIKQRMEDLLEGKSIFTELEEQIVFEELEWNGTAIWSLLLASGYLRVESCLSYLAAGGTEYELKLTNFEVLRMFERMIRLWFQRNHAGYCEFVKALLAGDIKAMNYYMNKVALATFSFFDTGKKPSEQSEPERFYHGFVLGLMVDSREDYIITSNRESGFGRYDVVMEPVSPANSELPAIVLEFKVRDPGEEKTLEDTVRAAHRQMEEKNYDVSLLHKGIAKERIRHFGFAFEGKKVLIG